MKAGDAAFKNTANRRIPAHRFLALLGMTVVAGCGGGSHEPPPPPPGAVPAGQAIGSSTIAGRAVFQGTPPVRRPIRMLGEAGCRHEDDPLSEEVIVNPDGTLRNVYVHVASGLEERVFAPPTEPAEMDQLGCIFIPHVLVVQADQVILFKSSDPVVHNVRAIADANPVFNLSMPGRGRTVKRFFSKPEIVRIRCDIHAWMEAFVAVEDHPFHAVTGDAGSFELRGLPSGSFEVEAWHETLGASRQAVTLADGERRDVEFTFTGSARP